MTPVPSTSSSAQNPKVLIATALITAVTMIGVSFVGIFPQLRSNDTKKYDQLQQQFEDFKQKAAVTTNGLNVSQDKKMAVNGTVFSAPDRKRTLNGVEIYLLPEGNNLLTAKTDDSGRFSLPDLPRGTYSIIVRDSAEGKSGKGLLDDSGYEVTVIGASITYHIQK